VKEKISAFEAQFEAQKIAFAPVIFQVVRTMRDFGILKLLSSHKEGLSLEEISEKSEVSVYGTKVLLESAVSASVVLVEDERYYLGKIGYFLENDKMTRINMDYNHYVNYQGLYDLDKSIKESRPVGLQVFGDWDTIYPHLSVLPLDAKKAWFNFDHFYSDSAFDDAIDIIKKLEVKTLLDIGGNTGKFSIRCAKRVDDISLTILDLPEQIDMAIANIKENNLEDRVNFYPLNILDHNNSIPKGFDIIWMSQFLDCFSEDDAIKILSRVAEAMDELSRIFILEPILDRQQHKTGSYCITNTSPYFTAMANGYSKMFNSKDLFAYIRKAGLEIEECYDDLGFSHSLVKCKKV
jgi:2-polyprenyl-3-methyl-5-hydroxy-6-metoxy-1,4-benzoquinol methylase